MTGIKRKRVNIRWLASSWMGLSVNKCLQQKKSVSFWEQWHQNKATSKQRVLIVLYSVTKLLPTVLHPMRGIYSPITVNNCIYCLWMYQTLLKIYSQFFRKRNNNKLINVDENVMLDDYKKWILFSMHYIKCISVQKNVMNKSEKSRHQVLIFF